MQTPFCAQGNCSGIEACGRGQQWQIGLSLLQDLLWTCLRWDCFFAGTKVQTVQLQGTFLERSCGDQFVLSWTCPQEFRSDKIAHLAIAHYTSPFFNRKWDVCCFSPMLSPGPPWQQHAHLEQLGRKSLVEYSGCGTASGTVQKMWLSLVIRRCLWGPVLSKRVLSATLALVYRESCWPERLGPKL